MAPGRRRWRDQQSPRRTVTAPRIGDRRVVTALQEQTYTLGGAS
jgi:hypothetical protein